jgi:integrase
MPTREAHALVLFAAQTGFRKGECFAPRWENVDLAEGDERARVVERVHKGVVLPVAKTDAGLREVLPGPRLAGVLRELSAAQLVDGRPNPHGLVFPSPNGER